METFRFKKVKSLKLEVSKALLVLTSVFWATHAFAFEKEQRASSNITNVTVFLNQAQVTRLTKVNLSAGVTQLVFDRVSPYININSIQVKADPAITLLSVSQRNNYLVNEEKPHFVLELEDSLAAIKNQVALLGIRKESLLMEKDVIVANKHIGGENSGVKIEDLEDVLVLVRKRTQEIGEELLQLNNQERKLSQVQKKLQSQLDNYLNNGNSALEIIVTVKTLSPVNNAKIEWSYLVGNASWMPFYDVRVKDTKSPLQLVSKANITQATGEDWNNVVLKLSTANPNESGSKPELQTNYLGYQTLQVKVQSSLVQKPKIKGGGADDMNYFVDGVKVAKEEMVASSGVAQTHHTDANIEFAVTSAYTVPSDNIPHQVDLSVLNLEATYAYGAVPKLDKDAFVTAKVSGNDLVNQVGGEANVYFDGTFIGKTYINGTTSDSMLISLGRDKRIQIQRTLLKDFSSKTFTGGSKKELSTWEISVRNTRKEGVWIIVEDQIPVSTDKDIEVKLLNSTNATYDETTGKLTWKILLEPEQTQTLKFSFEIKYPKEKVISNY